MSFNGSGIIYLDINDFDKNQIKYANGKPVTGNWVCMVQGSFCHYCTEAKPDFVNAKNNVGKDDVTFCTIQIDGDVNEKALGSKLKQITGLESSGVPAFMLFKNGKAVKMHNGGRDANSIAKFAKS